MVQINDKMFAAGFFCSSVLAMLEATDPEHHNVNI